MAFEILRPSEGKIFANEDESEFYTALILGPHDSINNYHEVDVEAVPEEPEPDPEDEEPESPEPDEGEEQIEPMTRAELTAKIVELEDELTAAKILLGVDE